MLIVMCMQLLQLMNTTLRGVTNGVEIAMTEASVGLEKEKYHLKFYAYNELKNLFLRKKNNKH